MAARAFDPLPVPGDIVYCRFPDRGGRPAPKPRPALVVAIVEFDDGTIGVRVAYGTSQKVDELRSGEFALLPSDRGAYRLSGLSFPTKFDFGNMQDLPYTEEWFRVPPAPEFGQTPKLGVLHPSLMKRADAAYQAARARTRK